jgi:hypothetical protein
MKDLAAFDFTPTYQPFEEEVVFRLQPLTLRGLYEVQASMTDRSVPGWEGIRAASQCIVGWRGTLMGDFSRDRVRSVVEGGPDVNWMIWLGHITGELYRQAMITETDAKK